VHFIRITSVRDALFAPAWALYSESFPKDERRSLAAQEKLLSDEDYRFEAICEDGGFAGLLLLWKTAEFVYVEHFAVCPQLRCRGVGGRALRLLLAQYPSVILEIEPPADTLSRRRKRFYERLGLRENPYLHVQPPYQADCGPTRLVVMSRPALTRAEFARFSAFFHTRVTGYRDAP
jgi:ribosomal protein S18 acetylase RimI-like enzyme